MSLTTIATEKWGKQHLSMPDWTEHYWRSREKPARQEVLTQLKGLWPFESLVELGCNSGPMLSLIHDAFPETRLAGLETNALAVEACARNVPGITVHLGDLMRWLPERSAEAYDVILTYYTLAYISPEDLPAVLWQCWRVCGKGLLLAEPLARPDEPAGLVYHYPEWRHDYQRVLRELGVTSTVYPCSRDGYLNDILVAQK